MRKPTKGRAYLDGPPSPRTMHRRLHQIVPRPGCHICAHPQESFHHTSFAVKRRIVKRIVPSAHLGGVVLLVYIGPVFDRLRNGIDIPGDAGSVQRR